MNKFLLSTLAAVGLLMLSLLARPTWAQDATGKIAGNITDATGALVSGRHCGGNQPRHENQQENHHRQSRFLPDHPASDRKLRSERTGYRIQPGRSQAPGSRNQSDAARGSEPGGGRGQCQCHGPGPAPQRGDGELHRRAAPSPAKPFSSSRSTDAIRWICSPPNPVSQ